MLFSLANMLRDVVHVKFGMAKFGRAKIWHQFLNLVQQSPPKRVAHQATNSNGGHRFGWAFGWLLLFLGGLEPAKTSLQSRLHRHKRNVHAKSANNDTCENGLERSNAPAQLGTHLLCLIFPFQISGVFQPPPPPVQL